MHSYLLTNFQFTNLISQIVTSRWGGFRKLPYAFTEQGLAMLSGVLNSDIAIQVNINIMRAFVAVRQILYTPIPERLTKLEKEMVKLKDYIEEVISDSNDTYQSGCFLI